MDDGTEGENPNFPLLLNGMLGQIWLSPKIGPKDVDASCGLPHNVAGRQETVRKRLLFSSSPQVAEYRYNMYSCFMQIPQGTVRTLALKPINLDEDDDDEEDGDGTDPATMAEHPDRASGAAGDGEGGAGGGRSLGGVGAESNATSIFMSAVDGDAHGGGARSMKQWDSMGGKSLSGDGMTFDQMDEPKPSIWSRLKNFAMSGRLGNQVGPEG